MIDKLQGLGLLPGLMTGTRGLEAREVALEAGKEENVGDPFVDGMLRFLQLEGARDLDFRIGGGLGYSNAGYIPPNAQGVPVPDGAGYRVNGFFRAAPYRLARLPGAGRGRGRKRRRADGADRGNVPAPGVAPGDPRGGALRRVVRAGAARRPPLHDERRAPDRGPDPQPPPDRLPESDRLPGGVPVRLLHGPDRHRRPRIPTPWSRGCASPSARTATSSSGPPARSISGGRGRTKAFPPSGIS